MNKQEVTVYCYPKCSTCRKAVGFLDDHDISYHYIDIVKDPPSAETLTACIEKSGLPDRRFFNTSGMRYRELGLKDKLGTMEPAEKTALLASDGMLIKRPLLITGDTVIPGFKEAAWRSALGLPEEN
ncbi:MAG: arsenate reductase family protein [Eubacteriaceae bacterium]|jgi:arsenate reductase